MAAGPDCSLLVATRSGAVEMHAIGGGRSSRLALFRTVCSRVFTMARSADSVVTIEEERAGSSMQCVRVYSGWRKPETMKVVALSLSSPVDVLACCSEGQSHFAVASMNGITLYDCSTGPIVPMAEIAVSGVTNVALRGQYLAWSSGCTVNVLQLDVVKNDADSGLDTANELTCAQVTVKGPIAAARVLRVPGLTRSVEPFVALGPFQTLEVSVKPDEGFHVQTCVTLLVSRLDGAVHSLQLASEPNLLSAAVESDRTFLPLVRCLASSQDGALLFSLSKPAVLARYTYTSPTFAAMMDECFIYALQSDVASRAGSAMVEVFSLRPSQIALPLKSRARADQGNDAASSGWFLLENSAPEDAELELPGPCMLASLPLVGLQAIAGLAGGSVGLMSKVETKTECFWSVSVLFPERAVEMWKELALKAAQVGDADTDTMLLLHLEGLLVLGTRLVALTLAPEPDLLASLSRDGSAQNMSVSNDASIHEIIPDQQDATRSLFLESCRTLGNLCERRRVFQAAALFWAMGELAVDEVTRRLLPERAAAMALVEFIHRRGNQLASVGIGVGNSLIEHLARHQPSELPDTVLAGRLAHDASLAVDLLIRAGTPVEAFARAYCLSLVGSSAQSGEILRSIDCIVLHQLLQAYPHVWSMSRGLENNHDGELLILTTFGELVLKHAGFSLLETVVQMSQILPKNAAGILGGAENPLYLMYLENCFSGANERTIASVSMLLASGYAGRCEHQETKRLPSQYWGIVEQFGSMRTHEVAAAPLEVRWPLRHWRGLGKRSAQLTWLDNVPPGGTGHEESRRFFYVGKLQRLLVELQLMEGPLVLDTLAVCAAYLESLGPDVSFAPYTALFWLPALNRLNDAMQRVRASFFTADARLGFCLLYCNTPDEWRLVLQLVAAEDSDEPHAHTDAKGAVAVVKLGEKPLLYRAKGGVSVVGVGEELSLYQALLNRCTQLFDPEQLILHVLPEDSRATDCVLPLLWRSYERHSVNLMGPVANYAAQN